MIGTRGPRQRDGMAVALETGLVAILVLVPLPFGSVGALPRLALECASLLLVLLWAVRAAGGRHELPPLPVWCGLIGMLGLALLQTLPLPEPLIGMLAPQATEIRTLVEPSTPIRRAEATRLGEDLSLLRPDSTLSVDPAATASALRSGVALAGLFLVSASVAATRGPRRLALALLVSAAFQGLYGFYVLVSDQPRIWNVPKRYGLDAATGTFVNRNHYACLLAMSLACGAALLLSNVRHLKASTNRKRILDWLGPTGSRNLITALLLVLGLLGLLLSFSRAGIAVGVLALGLTLWSAGAEHAPRTRLVVGTLVLAAALLPALQVGSDRLVERFGRTAEDLEQGSGRVTVWRDTLSLAAAFPVFGSGYGTFAQVYPLFRSPQVRKYYHHAHNDPLQALAEGGAVGAIFLLLLVAPVVGATVAGIRGAKGPVAVGFAAACVAVGLHSLVDFPFHIPALAATAAILAGTLLGLPCTARR